MPVTHHTFSTKTDAKHQVVDITAEVKEAVAKARCRDGMCTIYTPHATAAIIR